MHFLVPKKLVVVIRLLNLIRVATGLIVSFFSMNRKLQPRYFRVKNLNRVKAPSMVLFVCSTFLVKIMLFIFYSIELEKQKAEHDKKMRLAEEKKQQVKNTINKLRRDFRKLKAKNGELPSYLQLPAEVKRNFNVILWLEMFLISFPRFGSFF